MDRDRCDMFRIVIFRAWSTAAPWADMVDMQHDVDIIGRPFSTKSTAVTVALQKSSAHLRCRRVLKCLPRKVCLWQESDSA